MTITGSMEINNRRRELLSGNHAAAWGARTSRADLVPAYPITPQTDVVEQLAAWVDKREMETDAKFLRMESEHSVGAALVGASMAGARAFTATSGQGTLYMMEMLYWLAGMRLPVGICTANRGIAPPWNIWADHQEVSALRTTGMVVAIESNPEAVYDAIPQMYKVCEDKRVLLPWVLSYDGFKTSHRSMSISLIEPEEMDNFLPRPPEKGWPHVFMDPDRPAGYGMMQHPEFGTFAELQVMKDNAMRRSIHLFEKAAKDYEKLFGRYHGGLIKEYLCEDADAILVSAGSLADQAETVVDEMRKDGKKAGAIKLRIIRPFPKEQFKKYEGVRMAVLDRNIDFSLGAMMINDIKASINNPNIYGVIGGLGGRSVSMEDQERILNSLLEGNEPPKYVNIDVDGVAEVNFGLPWIGSSTKTGEQLKPMNKLEERWIGDDQEYWLRGNSSCPGCMSTLGLRHVLKTLGRDIAVVAPASCANVYIGMYPKSASGVPWTNMAFASAAAAATGMKAEFDRRGRKINVVCWAGDGGTYDIGLQSLSGAAERGSDIIYICYNNSAYMNTGTQASSATPKGVITTTTPTGKIQDAKNLPIIMANHNIPYVATLSPVHLNDLRKKVGKARDYAGQGLKYLEMIAPCPPGWGYPTDKSVTVTELAVSSGAWLLFEVDHGILKLTDQTLKIAEKPELKTPLEDYFGLQNRYKNLSKDQIRLMQEYVNQRLDDYSERHGKKIVF